MSSAPVRVLLAGIVNTTAVAMLSITAVVLLAGALVSDDAARNALVRACLGWLAVCLAAGLLLHILAPEPRGGSKGRGR